MKKQQDPPAAEQQDMLRFQKTQRNQNVLEHGNSEAISQVVYRNHAHISEAQGIADNF